MVYKMTFGKWLSFFSKTCEQWEPGQRSHRPSVPVENKKVYTVNGSQVDGHFPSLSLELPSTNSVLQWTLFFQRSKSGLLLPVLRLIISLRGVASKTQSISNQIEPF